MSHTYVRQVREAKKSLRKEQRRNAARIRNQKVEYDVGTENNSKTFFKLIREQRKTAIAQTETLIVGDKTYCFLFCFVFFCGAPTEFPTCSMF